MWKGLTFVLPFLFFGYFFQLYNAYTLLVLAVYSNFKEWHVLALGLIHLLLFTGNLLTSLKVIRQKLQAEGSINFLYKKYKFQNSGSHAKTL
ncbi:hypothetical protein ACOMHN_038285 [Nucella lapillus]